MLCDCGLPAVERIADRAGGNQGRKVLCCAKVNLGVAGLPCQFLRFTDQAPRSFGTKRTFDDAMDSHRGSSAPGRPPVAASPSGQTSASDPFS